jgi:hypothetical protein
MPRMKILNSVEREVFDWPPIFNSVERKRCFNFPTPLRNCTASVQRDRHSTDPVCMAFEPADRVAGLQVPVPLVSS